MKEKIKRFNFYLLGVIIIELTTFVGITIAGILIGG